MCAESRCQLSAVPKDKPPQRTVHDLLLHWRHDTGLDQRHHNFYTLCREQSALESSPMAEIIGRQSVKTLKKARRIDLNGFEGSKRLKGKNWHVLVEM